MTYNSSGTYAPASGALTAAPGQVVQSAIWDNIFTDMTGAFSEVGVGLVNLNGFRNILAANGGFEVWQRGAGSGASIAVGASTTQYTADRWYIATNANQASVVAATAGLTSGSNLAAKVTRNSGQTGIVTMAFGFPLDTDEIVRMRGQKISLSFVAKAGANWSPASGTLTCSLQTGTAAPTKLINGYSGLATAVTLAVNLTPGGTAVTTGGISVGTIPLNATQAEVAFTWTPVGTAGADDSFTIDDVMLSYDGINTNGFISAYERLPFEVMLGLCKRHYRKSFPYSLAPAQGAGISGAAQLVAAAANASAGFWIQHYPISLRTTAAYTSYNPSGASANAQNLSTLTSIAVTLDPSGANSPDGNLLYLTTSVSGAGNIVAIHYQADAGI
jgi:hypothetical protein